ncbi:MAG: guanylate kinase [Eubacterium sp.]|nr:guanylate kinase [Eubacterium sp.]
MGKLFYLMGKSATGKDHVYHALLSDQALDLHPLVLYTTRPMREGERDGREYHFTDLSHLQTLREKGLVIEERVYQTISGPWHYATVDDGSLRLDRQSYLSIGTLESFRKIRAHFGPQAVIPLYLETEDGLRLTHALQREKKQPRPNYAELCRRFLADNEDFSEDKITGAGITDRIPNNTTLAACIEAARGRIMDCLSEKIVEPDRTI